MGCFLASLENFLLFLEHFEFSLTSYRGQRLLICWCLRLILKIRFKNKESLLSNANMIISGPGKLNINFTHFTLTWTSAFFCGVKTIWATLTRPLHNSVQSLLYKWAFDLDQHQKQLKIVNLSQSQGRLILFTKYSFTNADCSSFTNYLNPILIYFCLPLKLKILLAVVASNKNAIFSWCLNFYYNIDFYRANWDFYINCILKRRKYLIPLLKLHQKV